MLSLLSLLLGSAFCSEEAQLRNHIMNGYNRYVRPVTNYSDTLQVNMGLAVQNIESFDQIKETLSLNIWVRMEWKNDFLVWNNSVSNITFLSVDSSTVWVPDIELLNAASQPDIYILNQGMNLYQSGDFFRSNPGIFKFSCPLDLHEFPFDIQTCTMRFGSWTYNNELVNVLPYENEERQLDVLSSFSHSEWEIIDYFVESLNETRVCCPGKNYSVNEYVFNFQRYPHYYKLSMGMTISLVLVSFIIMLIKPDNVSRTGTAVFIPLTILALQLTIADKIPVVGYYTLMDNFFLCCFITSMICSIESGLIYALVTTKNRFVYRLFVNCFNFDKLYRNYKQNIVQGDKKKNNHQNFLKELLSNYNQNESGTTTQETNLDNVNVSNDDFKFTIMRLNALGNESNTDNEILNNEVNDSNKVSETNDVNEVNESNSLESNIKEYDNNELNIVDKEVVKVISYDNENLDISLKEKLVYDEIRRIFEIVDNIFRILLPIIYFIYIIILMSNEK